MGFTESCARLLLVVLWGAVGWSSAETGGAAEITVLLLNHAKLSRDVISNSEAEATRIFSASGIRLRWVDCSQTPVCHHVPGANEFVLSIVADGHTSSELVYGVAFLGPAVKASTLTFSCGGSKSPPGKAGSVYSGFSEQWQPMNWDTCCWVRTLTAMKASCARYGRRRCCSAWKWAACCSQRTNR